MTTNPQPPPEAALIRTAREAPPHMKIRHAASLAGISEGRWRQLENGGWKRRGRWEAEIAPADTLARMARAVGITPDALRACRPDAAAELAALPPLQLPLDPVGELFAITRELRRRIDELEQGKDDDDENGNGHSHAV